MKIKKHSAPKLQARHPNDEPTHAEIALATYSVWEKAGRRQGCKVAHWLQAEAEVQERLKQPAGQS